MKEFVQLYEALGRTSDEAGKQSLLEEYFRAVPAADAAWALNFLLARWKRSVVKRSHLIECVMEFTGLPEWMVDECHAHVGDLAETLALLVPPPVATIPMPLHRMVQDRLLRFQAGTPAEQREILRQCWMEFDEATCFVWHKLLAGALRFDVPGIAVRRALAGFAGVDLPVMAYRIARDWVPSPESFAELVRPADTADKPAQAYAFCQITPRNGDPGALGSAGDWIVEWEHDGLRVQLLRRQGECVVWSVGEEIVTSDFPDVASAALALPDGCVLEGWLVASRSGGPMEPGVLQKRHQRRDPPPSLPGEAPIEFVAFDLLELDGVDWRERPLGERRQGLESLLCRADVARRTADERQGRRFVQADFFLGDSAPATSARLPLRVSPRLASSDWQEAARWHARARAECACGLMIRRRDSRYGLGPEEWKWWSWKLAPLTCLAVLVGVQSGKSGENRLSSEYSLAAWDKGALVTLARLEAGLTSLEMETVEAFAKVNTTKKFGPVRSVRPTLVFEVEFDGITRSTRHKAGLVLRSGRIKRLRPEKCPEEADSLESLRRLTEPRDSNSATGSDPA